MYPRLNIRLEIIEKNIQIIIHECKIRGIEPVGITKVHRADKKIVELLIKNGFKKIGDSRLLNIKKIKYDAEKLLTRIPMPSEVEELVKYATSTLISSVYTAKLIDKEACKQKKLFKLILMYDIGDLREGIYGEDNFIKAAEEISSFKNVVLYGVGTNMGCMNGILPNDKNLSEIIRIKEKTEQAIGKEIEILSAGNTDVFAYLLKNNIYNQINELRIGEATVMGTDAAEGIIEILNQNAITLSAEIIEVYDKPSMPKGTSGINPFGEKIETNDMGVRRRAILAVGRQDINSAHMLPIDKNIIIIGQSSDHTVIDVTDVSNDYKIGDIIEFNLKYGGILSAYTSEFVYKNYI